MTEYKLRDEHLFTYFNQVQTRNQDIDRFKKVPISIDVLLNSVRLQQANILHSTSL